MTKPLPRDSIYLNLQFDAEIIVLCVRWYITYRLSYRDLVQMMAERGVLVSHTTIMRWVQRYVPEFEKRASHPEQPPRKITLDGYVPSHRAVRLLRREHPVWRRAELRCCQYLNNIVEQDRRAIKRRCRPMMGFKSFETTEVRIAGIELAHRIHKQQFSFGRGRPRNRDSLHTA